MCFGPVASFTASGFLFSIGAAVFKNIRSKKELLFAAFPILFAIQQLIEGFLWLALKNGKQEALTHGLAFAYLIFAYSVWPVLCPASVYMIEYDKKRKEILRAFMVLGVLVSACLFFSIFTKSIDASIVNCSIQYKTFVTGADWLGGFYVLATIAPYFISSQRAILIFGIPNLIFCAITYFVYTHAYTSTWCFFAAILSASLYFFLKRLHHEPLLPILEKIDFPHIHIK